MANNAHKMDYEVRKDWEQLPEGWSFTEVAGVAVDSKDQVYVFNRGAHPVIVFDKEGRFLNAWGEGQIVRAHGIFITPDDRVFLVDDGGHMVFEYTVDGQLKMRVGSGKPSDTGYERGKSKVARVAGPFNEVTNVAVLPDGDFYVSDGYGNARVHKFSAQGKLQYSWGQRGSGPGQFNLPHGIAVDSAGLVYVADRENSRVQIFTPMGEYLREWAWVNRPCDLYIDRQDVIHIAELGFNKFIPRTWPHLDIMKEPPHGHSPIARVSLCTPDGEIIAQVGGATEPILPGNFIAPHGLWADSRGDLYVGEVSQTSGAGKKYAPLTPHCFQKFTRGA